MHLGLQTGEFEVGILFGLNPGNIWNLEYLKRQIKFEEVGNQKAITTSLLHSNRRGKIKSSTLI